MRLMIALLEHEACVCQVKNMNSCLQFMDSSRTADCYLLVAKAITNFGPGVTIKK